MAAIKALDQHTINQIAAGEVIERPASVVKELVENAIDSKATAITVEIKEGGISFIRITDNGCGFYKEDIPMAFKRHTTSKIKAVEDLMTISSLGFRGEALSSISAVSQVELITKHESSLTGSRYLISGGKEVSFEEIGCPEGTTFIVRNLFYNTPARRKFLKSPTTEASYISDLVSRLAMSHPEISFKFVVNGKNKLYTSGNNQYKDVIFQVYGKEITSQLVSVNAQLGEIKITGYIGKPTLSRGNKSHENYFINQRYIKSSVITKAIEEGYHSFQMVHKFPFTALQFSIPSNQLDVNVHPTKMEVRIEYSDDLFQLIVTTIKETLLGKNLIPETTVEHNTTKKIPSMQPIDTRKQTNIPEPFEEKRKEDMLHMSKESAYYQQIVKPASVLKEERSYTEQKEKDRVEKPAVKLEDNSQLNTEVNQRLMKIETSQTEEKVEEKTEEPILKNTQQINMFGEEETSFLREEKEYKVIGQLFQTYWLIEAEGQLFIMDQHAAHEKVLYEKFLEEFQKKEIYSQMVLPPMVLSTTLKEAQTLKDNYETFAKLGFDIESIGSTEFFVREVPANLFELNEKELFIALLDELAEKEGAVSLELLQNKLASMACKAAVKGKQTLSVKEVEQLIKDLMKLNNPYNCPHGRPTMISMTQTELEKKFKRIQS